MPLEFVFGISFDAFDLCGGSETQKLNLSFDAMHYRSHPETINIGVEYVLLDLLALRSGYRSNTEENAFSFGFGLKRYGVAVDYAYTPFGLFDNVQRFTIRLAL